MKENQILIQNLKMLLWLGNREHTDRSYPDYIEQVSRSCSLPCADFVKILQGNRIPSSQELSQINATMQNVGMDLSDIETRLLFPDLVKTAGAELMDLNIQYLLHSVAAGRIQSFADAIGVNASTVSRWLRKKTKPDSYARKQISEYFGFGSEEELVLSFLFLGLDPVTDAQKRMYCQKLIDEIDRDAFLKIYPALKKLLR